LSGERDRDKRERGNEREGDEELAHTLYEITAGGDLWLVVGVRKRDSQRLTLPIKFRGAGQ
jgi:hypothetical protein